MRSVKITASEVTRIIALKDAPKPKANGDVLFSGRMQVAGSIIFNIYGVLTPKKDSVVATVFIQGGKLGGKNRKVIAQKKFKDIKKAKSYLAEVRKAMKFIKKIEKVAPKKGPAAKKASMKRKASMKKPVRPAKKEGSEPKAGMKRIKPKNYLK